jgi:hypothetical protein
MQVKEKMKQTKFIALLLFVMAILFTLPLTTQAAAVDLPCTPDLSLFGCVNQLYKYALIISSIGAVITIMIAGYMYIFSGGSDKRVGAAKSLISSSLLGIGVLLTGFLLLKQINPNILTIGNITPNQLEQRDWAVLPHDPPDGGGGGGGTGTGGGGTGGGGVPGTGKCQPAATGPASVANLQNSCFGANAAKASSIANLESGGIATRHGDKCEDGSYASWGLFQINISANTMAGLNCPAAFNQPAKGSTCILNAAGKCTATYRCRVVNQPLYQQCIAAAQNEANNIQAACRLSNNGVKWSPWSTNKVCNF